MVILIKRSFMALCQYITRYHHRDPLQKQVHNASSGEQFHSKVVKNLSDQEHLHSLEEWQSSQLAALPISSCISSHH